MCIILCDSAYRGPGWHVALVYRHCIITSITKAAWDMCRFFLEPKCQVAGVGRMAPEVTYIKMCVMLDRGLRFWRARYPQVEHRNLHVKRVGPHADPAVQGGTFPQLRGEPTRYTRMVATRARNMTGRKGISMDVVDTILQVCKASLKQHCRQDPDEILWLELANALKDPDTDPLDMFNHVDVSVFKRCQFDTFLASSDLAVTSFRSVGRSEAGSYCMFKTYSDAKVVYRPCYIKHFLLLQWKVKNTIERAARVTPVPYELDSRECAAFGQDVYRFTRAEMEEAQDKLVSLHHLVRPLILIKPVSGLVKCRLVQFQGCLLGGFHAADDDA